MWDGWIGLSAQPDINDGRGQRRTSCGAGERAEPDAQQTSSVGSGAVWCCVGLDAIVELVRGTAAVAGPLPVPFDDRGRAPRRRTTEQPVGFGHLTPCLVRRHGLARDIEVGGDVVGHPPIGGRIRLRHAANDTGGPLAPISSTPSRKPQSETGYKQSMTVNSAEDGSAGCRRQEGCVEMSNRTWMHGGAE